MASSTSSSSEQRWSTTTTSASVSANAGATAQATNEDDQHDQGDRLFKSVRTLQSVEPDNIEGLAQAEQAIRLDLSELRTGGGRILMPRDRRILRTNAMAIYQTCYDHAKTSVVHAKLRCLAADLFAFAFDSLSEPWATDDYILLVKMHMRAAKDVSEAGRPHAEAAPYFDKAHQFWTMASAAKGEALLKRHGDVLFSLLSWRSKSAWTAAASATPGSGTSTENESSALRDCQAALQLLGHPNVAHEVVNFAMHAFNLGVSLFNDGQPARALPWLGLSVTALEANTQAQLSADPTLASKQARTLRVLAMVHLELGHHVLALSTAELAAQLAESVDATAVRAVALLHLRRFSEAEEALSRALTDNDATLQRSTQLCLAATSAAAELSAQRLVPDGTQDADRSATPLAATSSTTATSAAATTTITTATLQQATQAACRAWDILQQRYPQDSSIAPARASAFLRGGLWSEAAAAVDAMASGRAAAKPRAGAGAGPAWNELLSSVWYLAVVPNFEKESYEEALVWLRRYALLLGPPAATPRPVPAALAGTAGTAGSTGYGGATAGRNPWAQCARATATVLLMLGRCEEAREQVGAALQLEPDSTATLVLQVRVALQECGGESRAAASAAGTTGADSRDEVLLQLLNRLLAAGGDQLGDELLVVAEDAERAGKKETAALALAAAVVSRRAMSNDNTARLCAAFHALRLGHRAAQDLRGHDADTDPKNPRSEASDAAVAGANHGKNENREAAAEDDVEMTGAGSRSAALSEAGGGTGNDDATGTDGGVSGRPPSTPLRRRTSSARRAALSDARCDTRSSEATRPRLQRIYGAMGQVLDVCSVALQLAATQAVGTGKSSHGGGDDSGRPCDSSPPVPVLWSTGWNLARWATIDEFPNEAASAWFALAKIAEARPESAEKAAVAAALRAAADAIISQAWTQPRESRPAVARAALEALSRADRLHPPGALRGDVEALVFAAKVLLEDPNLEHAVGQAAATSCVSADHLSWMAELAVTPPYDYQAAMVAASVLGLRARLHHPTVDWANAAAELRHSVSAASEPKATLELLGGALSLLKAADLSQQAQSYPVVEARWLVSRIWNRGVAAYHTGDLPLVERFFSTAIQFQQLLLPSESAAGPAINAALLSEAYSSLLREMHETRTTRSVR